MLELLKNIFMQQHLLMSNFDVVNVPSFLSQHHLLVYTLEAQARGMHWCILSSMLLLQAETIQVARKKLLGNEELSEHSELPWSKDRGHVSGSLWDLNLWASRCNILEKITIVFGGFSFMLFKLCRQVVTWILEGMMPRKVLRYLLIL